MYPSVCFEEVSARYSFASTPFITRHIVCHDEAIAVVLLSTLDTLSPRLMITIDAIATIITEATTIYMEALK